MTLRIGKRLFAPRAWSVLLTAIALAAFVSLGNWQLGRAREKQALTASFMAGSASTVDAAGLGFATLDRYQHVRLRGRYDGARQVLLDNMPSATGQPGYRVLTPLLRADGRGTALVDRGWVPLGASRAELPDVTVGADEREVTGILDGLPVPGLRVGPAAAPAPVPGRAYCCSRPRPTWNPRSAPMSNRGSSCSIPALPTVSSASGGPHSASGRSVTWATRSSGSRSRW